LTSKQHHLYVWFGGRWLKRVWSEADVKCHVDSAFKERERLFKLKRPGFSDDLSAKMCADSLKKLRMRAHIRQLFH
jgi:hypothetical protein